MLLRPKKKTMTSKPFRTIKCTLYKTLIQPVLIYGTEIWTLSQPDQNLLRSFERQISRNIYGVVQENELWRRRYNLEFCLLYNEPSVVKLIKILRLRWSGHKLWMRAESLLCKILNSRKTKNNIKYIDDVPSDP